MPRPKETNRSLHKEIGTRVRECRLARGWTQERLAEELDTQATTVSRYESGTIPLTLTMLFKVARVLGVGPERLIVPDPEGAPVKADPAICWRDLKPDDRALVEQLVERLSRH